MIPIARHLPKAYFQPLAPEPVRPSKVEVSEVRSEPRGERIIDAEWQQMAGSPARASATLPQGGDVLAAAGESPSTSHPPRLAAERYREMTPGPRPQRGSILDVSV